MQVEDPKQKRLKEQHEIEQKAKEAKAAGIASAHAAVREGEAKYEETRVRSVCCNVTLSFAAQRRWCVL